MLQDDGRFVGILTVFAFRLISGLINAFQVLLMRVIQGLGRYIYNAQRNERGRGLAFAVNGRFNRFLRSLDQAC